jgi:hypothetical protein
LVLLLILSVTLPAAGEVVVGVPGVRAVANQLRLAF